MSEKETSSFGGWLVLLMLIAGVIGVVIACMAASYKNYVGSALCLMAAAMSFGVTAYIAVHK